VLCRPAAVARCTAVLIAAVLIAACESSLPIAPEGAYEVPHDSRFLRVWAETESCSGLNRNPHLTRRFLVPGERVVMRNGEMVASFYDPRADIIYVPEGLRDDDWVLGHEILHALLIKQLGVRGHPPEYFVDRCGIFGPGQGDRTAARRRGPAAIGVG
jgi:hypothetical protein